MRRQTIITGLDIGSSKISAVTVRAGSASPFEVISESTQASRGILRGAIMDLNAAVGAVSKALSAARDRSPSGLGEIYVNISGETLKGARSTGMIPISLRGREITADDIRRCVNVASTIHLPFDREIIHKIVHRFSVDDQPWIMNPAGLYASRLSCEAYIITAGVNHIQSIFKCVNDSGYNVKEVIFTGVADGAGLLDIEQMKTGTALLDMGDSLTEMALFHNGSLYDMCVIPLGAEDIKGEIKDCSEFNRLISRISSRLDDFFKTTGTARSVILTGGMAFMDGLIESMEERLSCKIRMGVAKEVRGDISSADSVRLSTAIGLARYAAAKREKKAAQEKNPVKRLSNKVVEIFNHYF